ncbi:LamB/YcsF family protein [Leucobacter sp. HY1910]
MPAIDLNADLGEATGRDGIAADAAILAQVTSANVACGFHAGDPAGILRTCRIAAENRVSIGAHPGYRDAAGFGRRFIDYDPGVLEAETIYQVGAVRALAATVGAEVRYIKPHGALYNALAQHEAQALAVVRAAVATGLPLMVQASSRTVQLAADAGVRAIGEGFADRGYRPDGTLVPRSEPGALLGRDEAIAQALRIAQTGTVIAVGGVEIEVPAESICLHGDSPGAVLLAAEIRAELERAGVTVRACV